MRERIRFPFVSRFRVLSCANGTLIIRPVYKRRIGRPGLFTRLHLAAEIQRLLNGRAGK